MHKIVAISIEKGSKIVKLFLSALFVAVAIVVYWSLFIPNIPPQWFKIPPPFF